MNGLSFAHPWVLVLLPLIPLTSGAWFFGVRRGVRAARHVSRVPLAPPPYLAATLFSIAAVSAVLAAAQPRWGTVESRIPRTGADLVIVIDVSRSMDARDLQPGRLQAAKLAAVATLDRLGGDRAGLVVFAGSARTRFPLTTDFAAARQVIDSLVTGTIFVEGGTSAGLGLEEAVTLLSGQSTGGRLILLLTDGDDLGGDPAAAATRVRESGAELLIAGVGTPEGGTIPVIDPVTRAETPLTDGAGVPIVTRLDEPFLRTLAAAADGRYLGSDLSLVPAAIDGRLRALERTQFDERPTTLPVERYRYFAAAALVLLLLGSVAERYRRLPWRRGAAVIVAAAIFSGCATAEYSANEAGRSALRDGDPATAIEKFNEARQARPDDPRIALNLAAAYHAAGRFDEAITSARRALLSNSPETRAHAQSSIGRHQFAAGRLTDALDAFRRSLLEHPTDAARHDYEVVLRLLLPPEASPTPTPTPTPGAGEEPGEPSPAASPSPGAQPGTTPSPGAGGQGQPTPGQGTPSPGQPGTATPGTDTPVPGGSPGPGQPSPTLQELERALDEIDDEITRRLEEAGATPTTAEALEILNLLAERSRIAALRDAFGAGVSPGDR
ncbi:MAG TPA: VWA domain-containing protein [Tepidiformaceae bacterium]|nr:VWA domain-containing protein [Tepidiformaceae bacterium]